MTTKFLAIILSSLMFFFVVELIREEKLTFKYAFGWLIVSVLGILCAIFNHWLATLAHFFGFELASNFIFFVMLSAFVFLSLLLTIFLCQENKKNTKTAQKLSLLEFEINELKKNKKSS